MTETPAEDPAVLQDIQRMSLDEAREAEAAAHARVVALQQERKADVLRQIVEVARAHGVSGIEIAAAMGEVADGLAAEDAAIPGRQAPAKRRAEIKFRHPENPALEWAGRGKLPNWIRDSGQDKEHFRVA